MDKTFDETIDGVRHAERGVDVREDIAQGMEYVKQYAEEVTGQQQAALQAAQTATGAAGTATEKAAAAAESETAANTAATSAGQSAQAASADAQKAKNFAASAEESANKAIAAASTDKTLTIDGAPADAKVVGDALGARYTKEETDELLKEVNPFPVGSIYQSTDPTSPSALFGGTWEQIASERVLMGASDAHAAGSTAEAGLPNIAGTLPVAIGWGFNGNWEISGAFSKTNTRPFNPYIDSGDGSGLYFYYGTLDASRCSAIYGASDTVQPAAYYVYIWHRVA